MAPAARSTRSTRRPGSGADRWAGVPAMHAVTSLMRVQQLVIGRLDAILKPHGLTFARYEALVLLVFSSRGSLPLGKMGERLQVHPTSVTSIVRGWRPTGSSYAGPHPRGRPGRARRDHRRAGGRWSRRRPPTWSAPTSGSARSTTRTWQRLSALLPRCGTPPATSERPSDEPMRLDATYAAWGWRCRAPTRRRSGAVEAEGQADRLRRVLAATRPAMGFGFPQGRARRAGRLATPTRSSCRPTSDLRYQWVCAHLPRLDQDEMRELVVDAWRMCVPEDAARPAGAAPTRSPAVAPGRAGRSGARCGRCCTPTCTGSGRRRRAARPQPVLDHLRDHPTPRPPRAVEVRDGQVYRWTSG